MSKKALNAKFNIISFCIALIPIIAIISIVNDRRASINNFQFIFLIAALVFFLSGIFTLLYLFKKMQIILAMQLAGYSQEKQQLIIDLNVIREMTELAKNTSTADDVLKLVLDKAMQVIPVRNGSVFLVDSKEPEGLRFIAARPEIAIKHDDKKPPRHSFVRSVIESGKPLRIQDIEHDPRTMKSNDPKYGSPSFISMPVYKDKQVIAVLNMANKENGGLFTDHDERILSIMLGEIGFALENITLRRNIKELLFEIKELKNKLKK